MLAVVLVASGGCGFAGGRLPIVPFGSEEPGFKMLAPGAEARACGGILWPYGARADGGLLERAVEGLMVPYAEADTVRDLRVSWRGVDLLVAQIGCVSVRGDVGREIPTVKLPMLGEHAEHMHHGTDAPP
jgi:hypothetical protein